MVRVAGEHLGDGWIFCVADGAESIELLYLIQLTSMNPWYSSPLQQPLGRLRAGLIELAQSALDTVAGSKMP